MADDVRRRKVVLIGDGAVGKTALFRRYITGQFDEKYISTIGTANSKRSLNFGDVTLEMLIWDLMGQHVNPALLKAYLRGADGAILVGDLTRPETFNSWPDYWAPEVKKTKDNVPLILVCNKTDLEEEIDSIERGRNIRMVDYVNAEADRLKEQGYNVINGIFYTSAKTGKNVGEAFLILGRELLDVKI